MTSSDLHQEFCSPSASYRGKPFWSWNGDLREEELLRQAENFQKMGFGGYFMHSRIGLVTEYLGEEWFRLNNRLADEAARRGMEAWLYDEDRWPSGSAGGLAAQNPALRMQTVRLIRAGAGEAIHWDADTLAVFLVCLEGKSVSNVRRLPAGAVVPASATGEQILVFRRETMPANSFYNGAAYIDTTHRAATEEFLRLTHERYREKCGKRLGTSIKGIFTDEPHRGWIASSHSPVPDPEHVMPWGHDFAQKFRARWGYDLLDYLPALFFQLEGRRIDPVKWHYVELLQELFLENFLKPVYEWCDRHNLPLTGHVLHEDSLVAETVFNGSMMRNYPFFHAPGIDLLWENNRSYWAAKKVVSVARQFGKKQVLTELYGCTGWQFDFPAHKAVGDWQALFGINLRCHHLAWYSMAGEAKRDYPASISHQSAWWPWYRHVEDYFSRLHVFLGAGEATCDLLVLNPVESVWSQIHVGWSKWVEAGTPELVALEHAYEQVFHWLAGHHLDFDYGDEGILAAHATVEGIALRVGQARYRAVLVAGLETLRASTLQLLEDLVAAGGRVIFAGEAPAYVDARPSPQAESLAARAWRCGFSETELVAACRAAVGAPPVVCVTAEGGRAITDVFVQTRRVGDALHAVLLNTDRAAGRPGVEARFAAPGEVERWCPRSGERVRLTTRAIPAGGVAVSLDLPPAGEALLRHLPKADAALPVFLAERELARVSINGPYDYTLDEPNVLVLDRARWRVDGGDWQPETDVLKIDEIVRKRFGLGLRTGEMIQPWYRIKTGGSAPAPVCTLEMEFSFPIDERPVGEVGLVLESPSNFEVFFNGYALPADAWRDASWVDRCFSRAEVGDASATPLRSGVNVVALKTRFHAGVDLEALYLLGAFGVWLDGAAPRLGALPARLHAGSVVEQGLPFYGAGIAYRLLLPSPLVCEASRCLVLPAWEGACVVVNRSGSEEASVIAFHPHECRLASDLPEVIARVVLTRRNTFGPHHQLPLKEDAYHPGSFRSEGRNWAAHCNFWPAGLLAAPIVSERADILRFPSTLC